MVCTAGLEAFQIMHAKVPFAAGLLETLGQLEASARDSLDGASRYLRRGFRIIDASEAAAIGGWTQFLNEADKPPSVTGTSHGILALLACHELPDSNVVKSATRFLAARQCADGGWTKPSLHDKCSLTRISGLALRALLDSGFHHSSPTVQRGVQWLLQAQNDDGGWGNVAHDSDSDVTSTSFALQAMTRVVGIAQAGRDVIRKGQAWITDARNGDHSWGYTKDKPGTVAHTSEAIDGLLACGRNPGMLRPTTEWLTQHVSEEDQFNERYLIPHEPCAGTSVIWTQCSKERGLVALLALGTNVIAPAVLGTVSDILSRQVDATYWKTEAFHDAEPIWAVKEAVVALRLFQDRVERDRAAVVLSEEMVSIRKQLDAVQLNVNELLNREARRSWRGRVKAGWSAIRRPSGVAGVLTLILIILYAVFRRVLKLPDYADVLATTAGFGGIALTAYQVLRDVRGGKMK